MNPATPNPNARNSTSWPRFSAAVVRGFHAYASWLVGISWRRFFVLSLLLLIVAAILTEIPPFNLKISETISERPRVVHRKAERAPQPPTPPATPTAPSLPAAGASSAASQPVAAASAPAPAATAASASDASPPSKKRITISVGDEGVKIFEGAGTSKEATIRIGEGGIEIHAPKEHDGEAEAESEKEAEHKAQSPRTVHIELPERADEDDVAKALEEFKAEVEGLTDIDPDKLGVRHHIETTRLGDFLPNLALLIIFASIFIKITYKGRIQAEAVAAAATETAEHEQLKRQVMEARMAAMQAQVEPHFLFNTLASIEHLIETDPPRAARMQRTLIDFLRAAMPTLREANAQAVRDLGRELAVVRPYLDILKMRMEDRLSVNIEVPEGLLSAEFPPLMLQSLVENAIKHGLEPKAEGGTLSLSAQVMHGKLAVTVADTGLGFDAAAANGTGGTGIGLSNIRERLQLIYGDSANLRIEAMEAGGTRATITLPYLARATDATPA
jgi:signal transduction histidine kinase